MISTIAAAALVTTMRLVASHEYAEGAPPGFSGGFKEESCHACHFHEELNAAPGSVTITGVPERFTPGQRYTITVTLTRSEMKRAGFQLTARFKESGAQAGLMTSEGAHVSIDTQGGIQYAGQKREGAVAESAGTARWTVMWTAPDPGGPVVFHVAANAANGNASADGDFIYTSSVEAKH